MSFFVPTSYDTEKRVDEWLRGTSKFNVSVTHLAMSEANLFLIFQLLDTYATVFEKVEEKPKLWVPDNSFQKL